MVYKYSQIVFGLLLLYNVTKQHYIPPPDFCAFAKTCNHTGVSICGVENLNTRLFLDKCDLFEYNCDKHKEYTETNIEKCPSNETVLNSTIILSSITTTITLNISVPVETTTNSANTSKIVNSNVTEANTKPSSVTAEMTTIITHNNSSYFNATCVCPTVTCPVLNITTPMISPNVTRSSIATTPVIVPSTEAKNNVTSTEVATNLPNNETIVNETVTSPIVSTATSSKKTALTTSSLVNETVTSPIVSTATSSTKTALTTSSLVNETVTSPIVSTTTSSTKTALTTSSMVNETVTSPIVSTTTSSTKTALTTSSMVNETVTSPIVSTTTSSTKTALTTSSIVNETVTSPIVSTTTNSTKTALTTCTNRITTSNFTSSQIEKITTTAQTFPKSSKIKEDEQATTGKETKTSQDTCAYPKHCNRPSTWETTVKGETRDFYQILRAQFGDRVKILRGTTHFPRRIAKAINDDDEEFHFGYHNERMNEVL